MTDFAYTADDLRNLLGVKEIDLYVLRRELAKAEEVEAALLQRVQELETQLAQPRENGHEPVGVRGQELPDD